MFNKLSRENKKKMFLNAFVYYPLAFLIAISVAIAVLRYIGLMDDIPVGFIILLVIIGIFTGVKQISQIYNNLLRKDDNKTDM